jgi:RNA polymerase sigma-70 factor (ECF subfamily)
MEDEYKNSTDIYIWKEFKQGNKQAYTYIYRTFAPVLYNYGYKICQNRELVEDCIQDLFIHLLLHKEHLADTDSIKYYLFKSLRRSIISKLDFQQKHDSGTDISTFDNFQIEFSHEVILIEQQFSQERMSTLTKAINSLPDRQKEAIFLRFYDDLTYEQIASIMAIDQRSVYKIIYKALHGLQHKLTHALISLFILSSFLKLLI